MSTSSSPRPSPSAPTATQFRTQIWHSTIPLQISISSSNPSSPSSPPPLYLNVPRLSYIPFLLPRLHRFFAPYLQDLQPTTSSANPNTTATEDTGPQLHDGWFSYDGVPLKWHYPAGLLHDLYAPSPSQSPPHNPTLPSPSPAPWPLLLHYTPPPPSLIPLDASGKVLQDAWINTLKESDYLRHGSAKSVMSLSVADSSKLWAGIEAHDLRRYWDVMGRLLNGTGVVLRAVPVRVYVPAPPPEGQKGALAQQQQQQQISVHQPPLPLSIPGRVPAQPQTVGTMLHMLLPNLFTSRRRCTLARPVLHGVEVPMEAGLEELMRGGMGYADGFLHVVVELLE